MDAFKLLRFALPFADVECFTSANYHDQMFAMAVIAMLIMVMLLLGVYNQQRTPDSTPSGVHSSKLLQFFIVPSYIVYPSTSSFFFQTFNCRTIDSKRFAPHCDSLQV